MNLNSITFPELNPPPGGSEMLRSRLMQEQEPPKLLSHNLRLAVLLVTLLLVSGLVLKTILPDQDDSLFLAQLQNNLNPSMFRLGLVKPPQEAVTVPVDQLNHITVQRVSVSDSRVIYYRIVAVEIANSGLDPKQN